MTRHTLDSVAALAHWLEKTFGLDVAVAGHPDPMTTTDWRYLAEKALDALPSPAPLIDREAAAAVMHATLRSVLVHTGSDDVCDECRRETAEFLAADRAIGAEAET